MHVDVGGASLWCEVTGAGEPLVLVHGSWGHHGDWDAVAPALAERHTVIAYDRRGHGSSAAPAPPTVHDHVADLAGLVAALGLGPVHVAAHSYGANIALRTAARHPGLLRSLAVHEPPLVRVLPATGPLAEGLRAFEAGYAAIAGHLRAGRNAEAARTFVDDVALGPGSWDALTDRARASFTRSAPAFLPEIEDPDALDLDLAALAVFRAPALLTLGGRSFALFAAVADRVAAALPNVTRATFPDAGHVPQLSHPREYVEVLAQFLARAPALRPDRE